MTDKDFACGSCGKTPADGVTVFRESAKGVKPVLWICHECKGIPDHLRVITAITGEQS